MKRIYWTWSLITFLLIFSGCSFTGKPDGGVYKSIDGGKTFQQKNKINKEANLSQSNVLCMAIDKNNPDTIYLGTKNSGLYRTIDGGENWVKDINNFSNITNVAIDPVSSQTIYVAASRGKRGKIYRTQNGGEDWKEIYTERTDGPIVLNLALDYSNPKIIYASNSSGGIFKSEDQGESWKTLLWAEDSVKKIVLDQADPNIIYFGTGSRGVMISKNGGKDFEEILPNRKVYALLPHPHKKGVLFLSDNKGLHRSDDFGKNWQTINTLVKPENLYSRGLAVNPENDQEILYSSGEALYKSLNGGESWMPVQFNFNRIIGSIVFKPGNPQVIYLGTRKISSSAFQLLPTL